MADVNEILGITSPGQRTNCRPAMEYHAAAHEVRVSQAPTGEPEATQRNNCRHSSRIPGEFPEDGGLRSEAEYGENLELYGEYRAQGYTRVATRGARRAEETSSPTTSRRTYARRHEGVANTI